MASKIRLKWYWALLWQTVAFSLVTAALVLAALMVPGDIAHFILRGAQWAVLPLFGGYSAYWATRRGLVNFAAWIAPPVLMTGVYWLMTRMPPLYFGGVLLCFFLSIVGASAGEVANQRSCRYSAPRERMGFQGVKPLGGVRGRSPGRRRP